MNGRDRHLLLTYGLLLSGALGLTALYAGRSRIWEFIDPFPRVIFFVLWLLSPFLLLAFNTFAVNRWMLRGRQGRMLIWGSLLFLGSGALIYGRALTLAADEVMEVNLLFLMGPLPHFAAAVLVSAGYLVQGIRSILPGPRQGQVHHGR